MADWSVSASVDREKIGLDDNLTLTITVSGDELSGLKKPVFPESDEWAFMGSSQSSSTNFQLIGTKMSRSITYTFRFTLAPQKKGTLTVPKLPIEANGETRHTQSFQVTVVEGSVGGGQARAAPAPNQPAPPQPASESDIGEDLFLSVHTDKTEAMVGEQINVTFTLYTRYNLSNISLSKDAVFDGFWADELYMAKQLDYQRRTVNGKVYNTVVIAKFGIFGLNAGEKTIEPMQLKCTVLTQRDFWGIFRGGKTVNVTGRPVKINIKPLPSNAPDDFDGLVGDFSITAEVKPDDPKSNEAMSYIILYSGTGNIHNLQAPKLEFPPSFEKYDVQESGNINKEGARISGNKRFEFVLVPRTAGEFQLPKARLVYYDLKSKKYVTKTAGPIDITVGQGKREQAGGVQLISRGEVFRVGEDIRYIAPDAKRLQMGTLSSGGIVRFWYLLPIELMFVLIIFFIRRRQDKLSSDIGYARYTRALRRAMAELRDAPAVTDDSEGFAGVVQDAVLHYLADRLGLPRESVVFTDIRDRLTERRIKDETLDQIEELLEQLSFLRFAPGDKEAASRELLDKAKMLITRVDKAFK